MTHPGPAELVARFATARRDPDRAILEGIHAIKHAVRFGAAFDDIVTSDADRLSALMHALAPDVHDIVMARISVVDAGVLAALSPTPPETGVIAIASRRHYTMADLQALPTSAPLVWLEDPTNIGNIGAAVRVAAAAGAAALVTTGVHDPWHPAALRGSAGLHYSLPVCRVPSFAIDTRTLVAIDGKGDSLRPGSLPDNAVFAFGSERRGISPALRSRADAVVAIPMEPGVSSLNLATAVAVALYSWRLGLAPRG